MHSREFFDGELWDLDYVAEFWPHRRVARFVRIVLPYDGLKIDIRRISLYGVALAADASCANNCSGFVGACDVSDGSCTCPSGRTGDDCALVQCPTCEHGACDGATGLCQCQWGFTGETCSESVTCAGPAGNECFGNGVCAAGQCQCDEGFNGTDCRYAVMPFRVHDAATGP